MSEEARILDVAIRHFAEYGYRGASIRKIADECRISHGKIHKMWPSKVDLLESSLNRAEHLALAEGILWGGGRPVEVDLVSDMLVLLRFTRIEDSSPVKLLARLNVEREEEIEHIVGPRIREGIKLLMNAMPSAKPGLSSDPRSRAALLSSFITGWVLLNGTFKDDFGLCEREFSVLRSEVIDMILSALVLPRPGKML